MKTCQKKHAEEFPHQLAAKHRIIDVAAGRKPADLVLKNCTYVNVFSNELCHGDIAITEGFFAGIADHYDGKQELDMTGKLLIPGLIDSHIHLESSLVSPREFARAVLPHGTTTVVTDPHEIANVMGVDGISYMLQATEHLPLDVLFMLPSCVPATPLDESGATLRYEDIDSFYDHPRVLGLAEMMNYVGIAAGLAEPLEKVTAAQLHGRRIDGHAPSLAGKELNAYVAAGVTSDHECYSYEDALNKLRFGQVIMIREGTAAQNLEALVSLLVPQYENGCMFSTDDKHPSDLLERGHIDYIIKKAISLGADPIIAVKAGSYHVARHFHLDQKGAIAPGYLADFAVIDNFENFHVEMVAKNGHICYNGTVADFPAAEIDPALAAKALDTFHLERLTADSFAAATPRAIIGMVPGEIVSEHKGYADGIDTERDILKIAVVERHRSTGHIGIGYITGYGLKQGAVATSISHDSHNIIAVGTDDREIADAVNRVVENHGGIVVMNGGSVVGELALPIAGLMTDEDVASVNEKLEQAKEAAFTLGVSRGIDPFMTLSFMGLPVIPAIRLTTRGMVDVTAQKYI